MELQNSVAELAVKTERLIADVEKQTSSLENVCHQIAFVKGALWVLVQRFGKTNHMLTDFQIVIPGRRSEAEASPGMTTHMIRTSKSLY
jgi:hypothetical protein